LPIARKELNKKHAVKKIGSHLDYCIINLNNSNEPVEPVIWVLNRRNEVFQGYGSDRELGPDMIFDPLMIVEVTGSSKLKPRENNRGRLMDIISHGLWGYLILRKIRPKIQFLTAIIFNILPDIIPFGLMTITILFTGEISSGSFSPETIPESIFTLYRLTHSLFTFLLLFSVVSLFLKRVYKPLLGWLIHILIDIPTHGTNAYITTFLYPFSDYAYDGLRWTNPTIIAINFVVLALLYIILYRKNELGLHHNKLNSYAWKILIVPTVILPIPFIMSLFFPGLYLESYTLSIANLKMSQIAAMNPDLIEILKLGFQMAGAGGLCLSIMSVIVLLTGFKQNRKWTWYALIPTWTFFWILVLILDFKANAGIYQYFYSIVAIILILIASVFFFNKK